MTLNTTVAASGVSIASSSQITFANAGYYLIEFAAQFTSSSGSNTVIDVWISKNGTNVTGTDQQVQLTGGSGALTVASWNYLVNPSANDYYVIYWSAPSTSVSMVYQAATTSPTRPSSPSVNVNVTQVMYTQSGYSGTSGYSGYSGISGYSGQSGFSGSGISGYSGYSGYSGSGISGYSGASGISGFSGYSGSIGSTTGSGAVVLQTTPSITTPVITGYTETAPAITNSSTAVTLSLSSGTVLSYTLTGNCTFTMPTATSGTSFILKLIQDGTGSRTATFTGVKWPSGTAPTITTTASTGLDILSFVCINSVWYGTYAQAFA